MNADTSNSQTSYPATHQQLTSFHLPTFDSFPYLMTRMVPALYHIAVLPRSYELELLRHIAQSQVAANQLEACLVIGSQDCHYYASDGTESQSSEIPHGGRIVFGKLRLCLQPEQDEDLKIREKLVEAYAQERNRGGGYIMGDTTKGGREATIWERMRLHGRQKNGVPRGLAQCPICGEWKGECLDPNPLFQNKVMRVCCLCENDHRCAACGQPLYRWKLNANYYDYSDGQVWHVPGFSGLSHRCEEVR
jgi:hypothetical protein